LKKEKENLALNYEQEEECLTNDLSRKLDQVYLHLWSTKVFASAFIHSLFFFANI
jgi:hypothetical protein